MNKMTLSDKIKKSLEQDDVKRGIEREVSINNMNDTQRLLYSYAMQVLTVPINVSERQVIPYKLMNAVNQAEMGNYKPLEDQRQFLIDYSMEL